jgi:hypothetical protein
MIEKVVSDVPAGGLNLVLDDTPAQASAAEPVEADVFFRWADEPDSEPQFLGKAAVGTKLVVPFDFQGGREIELFAVGITAAKELAATNPLNAPAVKFQPNLETAVPLISQNAPATNTSVDVKAENVTAQAKYRRIKLSTSSGMTSPLISIIRAIDTGGVLPQIQRVAKESEATAVARYITFEHSSNGVEWGTPSNVLPVLFADDTGAGAGAPPSELSGFASGSVVQLYWANNGGSSDNEIFRNSTSLGTVSPSTSFYEDNLTTEGYYTWYISNDDGSTNTWSYLYIS